MTHTPPAAFITLSALKDRTGWTDAAVRSFLGEPDVTRANPRFRSAAPMRLFALSRVEAVEASAEFASWVEKSTARRLAAQAVARAKREKTVAEAHATPIAVEVVGRPLLLHAAIESFNSRNWENPASQGSDPLFLARIQVNFARHHLTSYEADVDALFAKVGGSEAYWVIKRRVLDAIAEAYPHLRPEVERQKKRADSEESDERYW